jgi:hypothetical protein
VGGTGSIEVRDLRSDEVVEAVAVLARGMRNHPLHVAAYGDDPERRLHCHARLMLARTRKAVFHDPPTRRNRVWQTDFSEFETMAGGSWQLSGVVDYAAKFCLTCPVTATRPGATPSARWRPPASARRAARSAADQRLGRPQHRRA